jgi:hypothetical protein
MTTFLTLIALIKLVLMKIHNVDSRRRETMRLYVTCMAVNKETKVFFVFFKVAEDKYLLSQLSPSMDRYYSEKNIAYNGILMIRETQF